MRHRAGVEEAAGRCPARRVRRGQLRGQAGRVQRAGVGVQQQPGVGRDVPAGRHPLPDQVRGHPGGVRRHPVRDRGDRAERNADEEALQQRLGQLGVGQRGERAAAARRRGDQPDVVGAQRVPQQRRPGRADGRRGQHVECPQHPAALGAVAVRVQRAEQVVDRARRVPGGGPQQGGPAGVVHRPGVQVGRVGVRVQRPPAEAAADRREGPPDLLRVGRGGRRGGVQPGRRGRVEPLPQPGDGVGIRPRAAHPAITGRPEPSAGLAAPRSAASERAASSGPAWLCRGSSTEASPA